MVLSLQKAFRQVNSQFLGGTLLSVDKSLYKLVISFTFDRDYLSDMTLAISLIAKKEWYFLEGSCFPCKEGNSYMGIQAMECVILNNGQ